MNRPAARLPLLILALAFVAPPPSACADEADAIEALVPRLAHADRETRRAAARDLARLAHEACRPGAPSGRARAAATLVRALERRPRLPVESADAALRALARTAADAASIDALARLADDDLLGDRAFAALGAVPHPSAVAALVARRDDERALIALAEQGPRLDADAVGALLPIAVDDAPRRRVLARRALANSGHPAAARLLARAAADGDAASVDDLLRWAERTSDRGAGASAARTLLSATAPHHRAAAALFLGRAGEARDVLTLVGRLADDAPSVRGAAAEALRVHAHPGVDAILGGMVEHARPEQRGDLLRLLAARGAAEAGRLVLAAIDAEDDPLRRSALELAGGLVEPGLAERLLAVAAATDGATRDAALGAAIEQARRSTLEGDGDAARAVLHRVLGLDGSSTVARAALVRLATVADATSLEPLARLDGDEAVREEVARVRLALGRRLAAAGDRRARGVLERVVVDSSDRGRRREALDALVVLGVDVSLFPKRAGFLTDWHVAGPFAEATAGDLGTAPFSTDPVDLEAVRTGKGGAEIRWREHVTGDPDGIVDFAAEIGGEHAAAYATAEFTVRGGPGRLKVGSDDGVAIWLNGVLVHDRFVWRGVAPDQDVIDVRFADGVNRLTAKVSNGGGGWALCVRVADAAGRPIDLRSAEF